MAMAMGEGGGCGGAVVQQPIIGHHQPHDRLDTNHHWPRGPPPRGGSQPLQQQHPNNHRHPQSTQILHNLLSMKLQRHELVSDSPPGHVYVHPHHEDTYNPPPQARFPTPPSSLPSSPEPLQNYLGDLSGYGSSGGVSSRSSPSSTYSMDSAAASPRASSPGTSYSTGISRVYRYRRSQSSSREGSQSPSPYSSSSSSATQEKDDQPVNLRKRGHSSSPERQSPGNRQPLDDIYDEENKPMDLSVPSKKQRMEENSVESQKLSPASCLPSVLDSPPSAASMTSSKDSNYYHQHHNQHHRLHQRNPHLAYHPAASTRSSSPNLSSESILKSILCGQLSSRSSLPAQEEVMDDFRTASPFMYTLSSCQGLTRSPAQRVSELIRQAKIRQQSHKMTPAAAAAVVVEQEHRTQSPLPAQTSPILTHLASLPSAAVAASPPLQHPRNTVVSLAKKNLLPVTARISDWLVKVVQYVKSLPEFSSLPVNDKVTLVQSSWSRLLLLKMAESNFQFAVNPCPASTPPAGSLSDDVKSGAMSDASSSLTQPTIESVEGIMGFVRKCQVLGITSDEMSFLRLLTLFNPSHVAVESSTYIEKISTYVRKCLHDSCAESGSTAGNRRYCQLLLVLPPLFGVRPEVMELLFCKHITVNTDMDLLLKEMLHKL